MIKNANLTKEVFFDYIKTYITKEEDLALIKKAYSYVEDKHKHQKRNSGEPYIVHLLNVAYEVSLLKSGPKTVAAALLHDVLEDCDISKEEFLNDFDEEIYTLVEGVTKIGKLKEEFKDEKEYLAANHRKIFIAMAKDFRVIIIKLVDRLHNMRTLEYMHPDKQKRIAKETLDVYAPIAHRLGIAEIKNELEDLAFMYLNYDKYKEIAKMVENKKSERDQQVNVMIQEISKNLEDRGIKYRIFGRSKHLYSIYKKMTTKNKRFDEILDLLAIRVITETKLNCYEILGYIHAYYKPIPGRLKDYIAMPKMNLYQSLHTTIVSHNGLIFEVQIRTEEMNDIAEKGVAAHWTYKEGKNANQKNVQEALKKEFAWITAFDESNNSGNAQSYMETVYNDVFNANIYVLSPKGRVIDLPPSSTPIDFAYRIHSEVGDQTVGSKVNDVLVPLNTVLKTGDVVEILTDKKSAPSEGWLQFVKTNNAKNRIRSYLLRKEHESRQNIIRQAESNFKDELRKRNLDVEEYFNEEKLDETARWLSCSNASEMMYKYGTKVFSAKFIIERLTREKKNDLDLAQLEFNLKKANERHKRSISKTGVIVEGVDSIKISLSSCCQPIYKDPIIGYITKGLGARVHRVNCPKIQNIKERLIDVYWSDVKDANIRYETTIKVYASDRNFLLTDLATLTAQLKVTLINLKASTNRQTLTSTIKMTVVVEDLKHLDHLIVNIKKINNVISVERIFK